MKKRILACTLCLFLMFGMVPTAFAEGETPELYTELLGSQEAQLPEGHKQLYIYEEPSIVGTAGGRRGLILSLTADGEALSNDGWTPSSSDEKLGLLEYEEGSWHWRLNQAIPGTSGYLTITDENDQSYSIFAVIEPAVTGLYTQSFINPDDPGEGYLVRDDGCHTVLYDGAEGTRAVYAVPGYENLTILKESIEHTNADQFELSVLENGALKIALQESVLTETVSVEVFFEVLEERGNATRTIEQDFTIEFVCEREPEQEIVSIPEHDLKEEEKLPEEWRNYEFVGVGPVPFRYDGTTYYVGRGSDGIVMNAGGHTADWDEVRQNTCEISFWTMDREGNYDPVEDAALLEQLRGQFTSLTLSLYADNQIDSEKYPDMYPDVTYNADGTMHCRFTNRQGGLWVYVMEGTLANGETLTSFSYFVYTFNPKTVYQATDLADANDYLEQLMAVGSNEENYIVELPAGELVGVLEIPEGQENKEIQLRVRGAVDENGMLLTTIKGGIVADGGRYILENLMLQGAGKWKESWPEDAEGLSGLPNIGLSGTATVHYDSCIFRDFDMAVLCTEGLRFGGVATHFLNNGIGVYVKTTSHTSGPLAMDWFYFEDNGTAIWIEQLEHRNGNMPMSFYSIDKTCFIDNGCDIRNNTGKKFFADGNYFEHDGNTIAAMKGNERPWLTGKVYIAPIYQKYEIVESHEAYNGEIIVSDPYLGKYPTVKNGNQATQSMYVQDLAGMTLNVIDEPDTEKETTITFQFEEPVETLSLFDGGENETFDATVQVEKNQTEIAVTINEIPVGLTATLTVSCGDWTAATVTLDEETITSTISDGNITFLAQQGGTYIIQKDLSDTGTIRAEVSEGILTVTNPAVQPADPVEMIIMVAGYTPEGEMTGCQVVDQNVTGVTEIELTVSGSLKVFLLKPGTYAPVYESLEL